MGIIGVCDFLREDTLMKKKVNISLDEDIAIRLKELAEKSKRSVSQWITDKVIEADADDLDDKSKKGGKK